MKIERFVDNPELSDIVDTVLDVFNRGLSAQGTSCLLLPKLLEIIERSNHEKGAFFKEEVLEKLLSFKWNKTTVGQMIVVFRDLSMNQEVLKKVVAKINKELPHVELQDLPSVVHQLLVLSSQVQN